MHPAPSAHFPISISCRPLSFSTPSLWDSPGHIRAARSHEGTHACAQRGGRWGPASRMVWAHPFAALAPGKLLERGAAGAGGFLAAPEQGRGWVPPPRPPGAGRMGLVTVISAPAGWGCGFLLLLQGEGGGEPAARPTWSGEARGGGSLAPPDPFLRPGCFGEAARRCRSAAVHEGWCTLVFAARPRARAPLWARAPEGLCALSCCDRGHQEGQDPIRAISPSSLLLFVPFPPKPLAPRALDGAVISPLPAPALLPPHPARGAADNALPAPAGPRSRRGEAPRGLPAPAERGAPCFLQEPLAPSPSSAPRGLRWEQSQVCAAKPRSEQPPAEWFWDAGCSGESEGSGVSPPAPAVCQASALPQQRAQTSGTRPRSLEMLPAWCSALGAPR